MINNEQPILHRLRLNPTQFGEESLGVIDSLLADVTRNTRSEDDGGFTQEISGDSVPYATYYSPEQKKSDNFRGPDFFVVLNTERKPRKSWVVWEEGGKHPNVIIELLSNSTANTDRTTKKEIYQDIFRTPEYFWFSPQTLEFKGFELIRGEYEEIQPNEQGQFWSQQLQLFLGIHEQRLRFFTPEGKWVPTPEESAQTEKQQREAIEERVLEAEAAAEAEKQQREATQQQLEIERRQREKLAAKLRELHIDPETL
jgi:Uma2 family endonuclease